MLWLPRSALLLAALVGVSGCGRHRTPVAGPGPDAAPPCTREAIWTEIQTLARPYRIEPAFVYALVGAESDFDPRAQNGEARGLMQLSPGTWSSVSDFAYEPTVWNWKENLRAGIDYLAHQRNHLRRHGHFSTALLAATFHYGYQHVADRDFDLARIPPPDTPLWRQLWRGVEKPLPPP